MSQPAASQGLARLRTMLGDALFERSGSGVRPTPRADRLAVAVQMALGTLEEALNVSQVFDPKRSSRVLRVHLSDIGEARFLPELVQALQHNAPGMRLEARPLAHNKIGAALDSGQLDLAIGFLPEVQDTLHQPLLSDRYVLLMRKGHPVAKLWNQLQKSKDPSTDAEQRVLTDLEFAAVRTHSDTLRILELMHWQHRLRLTVSHFLSLPGIVTNIAAFGAFVDLGIKQNGLIHKSKMSHKFIQDPNEVLKLGQELEVTVVSIDKDRDRIQLSLID
jgi:DNA-binding transcriptional LysR family regulator